MEVAEVRFPSSKGGDVGFHSAFDSKGQPQSSKMYRVRVIAGIGCECSSVNPTGAVIYHPQKYVACMA